MARQKTLESMFASINKEEMELFVERDFDTLNTRLEVEKAMESEVVKRSVGRPKKEVEVVLLTPKVENIAKATSSKTKVRGNYTNWFLPSLWGPIYAAMRQHKNYTSTLRYLKLKYKEPGKSSSVYDDLSRGTLWDWFTSTGELREGVKTKIDNETPFSESCQHRYVLSKFPILQEEIIEMLQAHRDAGQPLFASSIRNRIRGLIRKKEPSLLEGEGKTTFRVSLAWTRDFIKCNLNWSYRAATGVARKLPSNWEEQGLKMTQRVAYLVKAHSLPPELVVNTDQTGIHLVPTGGTRTWAHKGSKHVLVHGVEDKRQITVSVSSSAAGNLLPFQLVFTGLTQRSLPPRNTGRIACEEGGWHLTCTNNHWSNLTTCQEFVEKILQPYRLQQVEVLKMNKESKLVWLIDCWSVHKSKEFILWVKENHPQILLIFVPANCTSIFQPADVILQRPFKHAFRQEFDSYTSDDIDKQLEDKAAKDVKIDTKMSTLKPLLCGWLFKAWAHVNKPQMIKIGWSQCGLLQAFDTSFQVQAMDENMKTPLFEADSNVVQEDNIDTDESIEKVMEDSLARVAEIATSNKNSSLSNLKSKARKRYVPATQTPQIFIRIIVLCFGIG